MCPCIAAAKFSAIVVGGHRIGSKYFAAFTVATTAAITTASVTAAIAIVTSTAVAEHRTIAVV
jgi:hypothetical protein